MSSLSALQLAGVALLLAAVIGWIVLRVELWEEKKFLRKKLNESFEELSGRKR